MRAKPHKGNPPYPPCQGGKKKQSPSTWRGAFSTTALRKGGLLLAFGSGPNPPHLDDRADDAPGRRQNRDDEEQADDEDRPFGVLARKIVEVMDEARADEGADERSESADFASQLAGSFSHFPAIEPTCRSPP